MSLKLAQRSAIIAIGCLLLATASAWAADDLGPNGGVRLLLHAEKFHYPEGGITADPCTLFVPPINTDDFVVDWDVPSDTIIVWAYVYIPSELALCEVGFGIEYAGDGFDFMSSGTCAQLVAQDPESMGRWANSGSEIAFAYVPDKCIKYKQLAPFAWFVMQTPQGDGFFRLTPGVSSYGGEVADTTTVPPRANRIWDFGQIGFGETPGKLPIVDEATVPRAWGAEAASLR